MISAFSVMFTLVLFSELSSRLATVASPVTHVEDGEMEQDALGSLLDDDSLSEHGAVPPLYRRGPVLDNSISDEDGNPRIIFVSDMRQKGHGIRGLNSAFTRSLPLLTDRKLSLAPAEYSMKMDRRDADNHILRCMIGRVYRPCWQTSNNP